jgi:hypothetical protein
MKKIKSLYRYLFISVALAVSVIVWPLVNNTSNILLKADSGYTDYRITLDHNNQALGLTNTPSSNSYEVLTYLSNPVIMEYDNAIESSLGHIELKTSGTLRNAIDSPIGGIKSISIAASGSLLLKEGYDYDNLKVTPVVVDGITNFESDSRYFEIEALEDSELNNVAIIHECSEPSAPVYYSWQGTSIYETNNLDYGNTQVTYSGVVKTSYSRLFTSVSHDIASESGLALDFTNTGNNAAYVQIVLKDGSNNQFSWEEIHFAPGQNYNYRKALSVEVTEIELYIASYGSAVPDEATSGSFIVSSPKFVDLAKPWSGSSDYVHSAVDFGRMSVSYSSIGASSWKNLYLATTQDINTSNAVALDFVNTGITPVYVQVVLSRLKADQSGNEQFSWSTISFNPNETYSFRKLVTSAVTKIELYIASYSSSIPTEASSGSFIVTNPRFINLTNAPTWSGNTTYTLTSLANQSVGVSYTNATKGSWQNIKTTVYHSLDSANLMAMRFKNTGASTIYIFIKLKNALETEIHSRSFEVEESNTYVFTQKVTQDIAKIELYICSTTTIPDGTYAGSFNMSRPLFYIA